MLHDGFLLDVLERQRPSRMIAGIRAKRGASHATPEAGAQPTNERE